MRNIFMHIVLLFLVGCGVGACAQEKAATLQNGRALEEQGKYIGALENYQKMPSQEFRDVCAHNLRQLYGNILDALRAQQDNPDSAEAYYHLGKAYYEKARSLPEDQAVVPNAGFDTNAYFAEQRKQFQTQAQIALESATQRKQFQVQAQTALESATQLQANYQDMLLLEGNLYRDQGDPEKAILAYQQLVDLQPESPEVYDQLGMLLYDRGQTQEGLEFAKQAVTKAPDNPDAHFTLGRLYAREGNDELAIAEFQQTLCQNPHDPEAYYKLSQVYLSQANLMDAERVLRLGVLNNAASQKLALFYKALKSTLDSKELDEFIAIYKASGGQAVDRVMLDALKDKDLKASPELEIRYLRFVINIIERQRPYVLPCAGIEEYPYFKRQITWLQEKITKLEQSIQTQEKSSASNKKSTPAKP